MKPCCWSGGRPSGRATLSLRNGPQGSARQERMTDCRGRHDATGARVCGCQAIRDTRSGGGREATLARARAKPFQALSGATPPPRAILQADAAKRPLQGGSGSEDSAAGCFLVRCPAAQALWFRARVLVRDRAAFSMGASSVRMIKVHNRQRRAMEKGARNRTPCPSANASLPSQTPGPAPHQSPR